MSARRSWLRLAVVAGALALVGCPDEAPSDGGVDSGAAADPGGSADPGATPEAGVADPGPGPDGAADAGADASDVVDAGPPGTWRFVEVKTELPKEFVFKGLWAAETGKAVAVGNDGVVVRMVDGAWSIVSQGAGAQLLNGVYGASSADLWAVGKDGAMLRGTPSAFAPHAQTGLFPTLWGVHAADLANVHAVGLQGTILRFDGTQWHQASGPGQQTVDWTGMMGHGSELVLIGTAGTIAVSSGGVLSMLASPTAFDLRDVHTADGVTWWIVGAFGTVLTGDPTTGFAPVSVPEAAGATLHGVHAMADGTVYVVGEGGLLLRKGAAGWDKLDAKTPLTLYTVYVSPAGQLTATGDEGVLIVGDPDTGLQFLATLQDGGELYDSWGQGEGTVYLVGQDSEIFRKDGASWPDDAVPTTQHLRAVWGSSPSDIWAVGLAGVIVHYDGVAWAKVDSPTGSALEGLWGTGPSDVYACGASGTLLHWDGEAWRVLSSTTEQNLRAVFARAANDVWAVGTLGTVMRFGGLGWAQVRIAPIVYEDGSEEPVVDQLNGVWAAAADDAWAVGDAGQVVRWDGESWQSQQLDFGIGLRAVWGRAPDDVWAVGSEGHALHWDGESWSEVETGSIATLYAIDGDGGDQVLAVGDIGTVLRWTFIPE